MRRPEVTGTAGTGRIRERFLTAFLFDGFLESPRRPPILRLRLSRDRSALCIVGHPERVGRRRQDQRGFVQVWNYARLESALTRSGALDDPFRDQGGER